MFTSLLWFKVEYLHLSFVSFLKFQKMFTFNHKNAYNLLFLCV